MRAGKLNQRVTLQQATVTQDAAGELVPAWADFATVWASVVDISGREYVAAAAVQNTAQTKITIRYLVGITPAMRAVHGSDIYNIEAVLGQDKRTLLLMCARAE